MVNKPRVSRTIAGVYIGSAIFIASCIGFFIYAGLFTPMGSLGLMAATVSGIVEAIFVLILLSIYRTEYILTEEELVIKTTRLIGGTKRIFMRDITRIERTLIPFGLRLFGASFHGGYFQVPSLGRVFMAITNFNDGVLISTRGENFIITPDKPGEFIHTIKASKSRETNNPNGL
ncbi:MAG: PH domain-containing protein [Candidatus Bathyarchaeia archaeon]